MKPGNVLVGDDGMVKLADLGIARAIGAGNASEGSVVGTLPYMSPERLAGPGAGGPESDVYALAAVAFELLSGGPRARPPRRARRRRPRRSTSRGVAQRPRPAVAVLERALDEEPGKRQPSAGRFVDELERGLTAPCRQTARAGPGDGGGGPRTFRRTATRPRTAVRARTARARGARPASGCWRSACLRWRASRSAVAGGTRIPGARPSRPRRPTRRIPGSPAGGARGHARLGGGPGGRADLGRGAQRPRFLPDRGGALRRGDPGAAAGGRHFGQGSTDLTYAYALFNLGHALRLAGRPEEAIPVLQSGWSSRTSGAR